MWLVKKITLVNIIVIYDMVHQLPIILVKLYLWSNQDGQPS